MHQVPQDDVVDMVNGVKKSGESEIELEFIDVNHGRNVHAIVEVHREAAALYIHLRPDGHLK